MKQFGVPDFEQRNFTLKTMGDHCLVWCEDNLTGDEAITDENKFTQIQQKFDLIYDVETEIFGKAQGYIVSNPQELVSKVDDKINIVIMNPKNPNVGGFFSSNDMILQSAIDSIVENKSQKSNENQIIYINSYKINKDFDFSLSAIAHEFQHLLNFIHDCVSLGLDFQMWYSEMLSVLAQDIFHEELSPDSLEPYNRLELFKRFTNYGVTYWTPQPTITDTKCLIGYAVNYAFGAFLFRNYGGVELLKAMTSHENNVIHKDAINYALKKVYPDKNYTFDEIASQLHYIMLTANIDGNLEDNEKVFTLNREIKFTADSSGSEKEITVKRIELSKNSHVTFFNPYGKDELDVIYPYGFLISDLPQGYYQKIVYQKPYDDNIEIILY